MDLSYGEEYEAYRAEVRAFLEGWPLQGDEGKLPAVRVGGRVLFDPKDLRAFIDSSKAPKESG